MAFRILGYQVLNGDMGAVRLEVSSSENFNMLCKQTHTSFAQELLQHDYCINEI